MMNIGAIAKRLLRSCWLWTGVVLHLGAVVALLPLLNFDTLFELGWGNGMDGSTTLLDAIVWVLRIAPAAGCACYGIALWKECAAEQPAEELQHDPRGSC